MKAGSKELEQFIQAANAGDPRYKIHDVNQLIKEGILPMELKDDAFLRQKIDEIAKTFNQGEGRTIPVFWQISEQVNQETIGPDRVAKQP